MASHLGRAMDYSGGAPRVEVVEASSGIHLGHDFDGTLCINAAALLFVPHGRALPSWLPPPPAPAIAALLRREPAQVGSAQVATVAAGCFWSARRALASEPGVFAAIAGFCGGETNAPTYEQVSGGESGHVEAVQIAFDPHQTSYEAILAAFWRLVPDPTSRFRQGGDVGRQYETAIFYHSDEQAQLARESLGRMQSLAPAPIVTRLRPSREFFAAGVEHQR